MPQLSKDFANHKNRIELSNHLRFTREEPSISQGEIWREPPSGVSGASMQISQKNNPGSHFSEQPDEPMCRLARYIEDHAEESLPLTTLSKIANLSPEHLQKRFRKSLGVSPKEFQNNCRMKRLRSELQNQNSIADSIYSAGFGSPSRVYEKLDSQLGMTPREYRAFGKGVEISYAECETNFGRILLAASDRGICFLQFAESSEKLLALLEGEFPSASLQKMYDTQSDTFAEWMKQVNGYLDGQDTLHDLPLDIRGGVLQLKVWKYLQSIPRGETRSYSEVAAAIGHPNAARAVASACAKNRIALLIPCHRVLRGSGELAGYRWGLERKERLLSLEERNPVSGDKI